MKDMVEKSARDRLVKSAIERLEKLAEESDQIVEQVRATFSSVLFHQPTIPPSGAVPVQMDALPGSDLGQAMMRVAQHIDLNFDHIRDVIDSADL